MSVRASIPVYLPGQTVIGKAEVSPDGHEIILTIPGKEPIAELIGEDLLGVSFIYMSNDARDRVAEAGEEVDG